MNLLKRSLVIKIHNNVLELIGNTPIVELTKTVPQGKHRFFAKLEYLNPGLSVKDRVALAIIEGAEARGELKPGGTIVEATSGNTGVGLAMVAALKGYKAIFIMPEKMSVEKRATLKGYGAELVLTPNGVEPDDPRSHYSVAKKIAAETPGSFYTNQFHNMDNPAQHYKTTGPEIWDQMGGKVDLFVGGAGTGGTISGVGKFLKEKNPDVKIVCNDPVGSILYDLFYHGEVKNPPGSYQVEGIGEDMMPSCLQFDFIDDFVQVNDKESFTLCRELTRKEGMMIGPSSASALAGAIKYSEKLEKPSNIVVMFADNGTKYLSKTFNDEWLKEQDIL